MSGQRTESPLARWYREHGRHDLEWRATRERWEILVAEVMLAQTQVARVQAVYHPFLTRFPAPEVMAAAGPAAVIDAWGRLGYPRRARRLFDAAVIICESGWPADLTSLPGVGSYTAAAVAAEADDDPLAIGIDVNIRRVCERTRGGRVSDREAAAVAARVAFPLFGRDRMLALMDLGSLVCTARDPRCDECPLRRRCVTRGVGAFERPRRQTRYEGSFRQRRGAVLERVRACETLAIDEADREAVASLERDGLVEVSFGQVRLARR